MKLSVTGCNLYYFEAASKACFQSSDSGHLLVREKLFYLNYGNIPVMQRLGFVHTENLECFGHSSIEVLLRENCLICLYLHSEEA